MNRKTALAVVGGLSDPSKLPCFSYGLPAQACLRGQKLAQISGTVCEKCYADGRGNYRFPAVKNAQQRRLLSLNDPNWVEAMSSLLHFEEHMRWHDSGDLQSEWHLDKLIEVAKNTPNTLHWLPTHEYKMVENKVIPVNLVIRLSADLIDKPAQVVGFNTSTVHTQESMGYECPAPKQGGKCGKCRACWDRSIPNISYKRH